MKRRQSEIESPRRSSWQTPASCNFCRQKKIRCDRKRPCSNCTIREITCHYSAADANDEAARNRSTTGVGSPGISPLQSNKVLHGRAGRSDNSIPRVDPRLPPLRTVPSLGDTALEGDTNGVWAHLEEISSTPRADDEETRRGHQSRAITANTLSAQLHSTHAQNISAPDSAYLDDEDIGRLVVQLPNIYTARLLLQHYIQTLDILHRELHVPSARTLLESTYAQLWNSKPIPREVLAFFFSIFASSAFHICQGQSHPRCKEIQSTAKLYGTWRDIAMNLLLQRDLMVSKTVLSLQAMCILIYLVWDSEGQSPIYNTLRGIAHTKAFQMKIHRLDAGNAPPEDVIQTELKRRMWWCLASTDWIVATVPGPQEGLYTFNPKQYRVNYPSNVDDEDLQPGQYSIEEQPENEATSMSFFIQKTRFSEVCREVLDCIQESRFSIHPNDHELAIQLGNRYQAFIHGMPWFLQPGEDSDSRMTTLLEQRPYIFRQKYVLLHAVYSRMGRLHRPFLGRSLQDPRFALSRTVAITCAGQQLRFCRMVEPGDLCPYVRSHSIDQHVFGGLVLLSVDIILNRDEGGMESRLKELMDTAAMIKRKQQAFNPSNMGVVFAIDKLVEVLQTRSQGRPPQTSGETHQELEDDAEKAARTMVAHGNEKEVARIIAADEAFLQSFINQDMEGLWDELLNAPPYEDTFSTPWQ